MTGFSGKVKSKPITTRSVSFCHKTDGRFLEYKLNLNSLALSIPLNQRALINSHNCSIEFREGHAAELFAVG